MIGGKGMDDRKKRYLLQYGSLLILHLAIQTVLNRTV